MIYDIYFFKGVDFQYMKKRYSVALFTGNLENKFSEEIFLGAAHAAEQLDINLVVFPVRFIETIQHELIGSKYQYQHNCMFSYAENSSFDAIIVETAVISRFITTDTFLSVLERFKGTPVVTISEKIKDYPCISFDSNGIDLEIDHLIEKHNRKRIGFVTGPNTNLESVTRFERYKASLLKHGIPFDPKLVVEGDFTENCSEAIEKLLEKNRGNIDAICFANDAMAIAGYKVINDEGLNIGKDIMVTGFDDIPASISINPPLTTVRARYRDLGINAMNAVFQLMSGNEISDITVTTKLIERDSCGCISDISSDRESLEFIIKNDPEINSFMSKLHDIIFTYYSNTNYNSNRRLINLLLNFSSIFLTHIKNEEHSIDKNLIIFKFNVLLKYNILDFISVENFNFILSSLCDKAISITSSDERKSEIYKIFMTFYKETLEFTHNENKIYSEEIKSNFHKANSIMSSVIEGYESNSRNPLNVMHRFNNINIRSSYLYLHEEPVISHSRYDWVQPSFEMLNSFHLNSKFRSFSSGKKIQPKYLFNNKYMPEYRFTFIASPIYCREENYGLLLCEINASDYIFYNSIITSQISYAIKLRNMLDAQKAVQSDLIESLNKANTSNLALSKISKSDELTGIYNRRGFIEKTVSSIKRNAGKKGVVIYADMDNLKQINDIFGHDEGDFAIKKSAEILNECMRKNDVTARFGGDEFAAFAIVHEQNFSKIFHNRIEELCFKVNETSGKPYNIHLSVGVYEFNCNPDEDLTKIMNEADKVLYENKKSKNTSVLKNPSDIHKFKR